MPRVSLFYGITISMYYRDHNPPHIHALYGDFEATFLIDTGAVLAGTFPARAAALVQEWIALHRDELQANWSKARQRQALTPVAPLP